MNSDMIVVKKILERIARDLEQGYICQWCGHKTIAPKGGTCPNSPHHRHQYVKAEVKDNDDENK